MLAALATAALATPADMAVTGIGGQGVFDQGLGDGDIDPLLSERLRFTLSDGPTQAVLLADARFTIDPVPAAADPWEQHRVRTLGVQLASAQWVVLLGRHAVSRGGPRLVDGVQALYRPQGSDFTVGAWGGLAPDLFTTRPMLRAGGGPIVAWDRPTVQASLVGELLGAAGGLDRASVLAQARAAPTQDVDLTGRLDLQLTDSGLGLADGAVFGRFAPARSVRVDAVYDAYSSQQYLQTANRDPDLRRFDTRLQALGLAHWVPPELPDRSLYQVVGLGGSWQPPTAVAPRLALVSRYRSHPRLEERTARVVPQAGIVGLAGGRLDATVDVAWTWHGQTGARQDVGLGLVLDPTAEGRVTLDGSLRLLMDPAFGTPGWYSDLFVDLLPVDVAVVVVGASATREPSSVPGVGVAGFVWLQHRWRRDQTTRLP